MKVFLVVRNQFQWSDEFYFYTDPALDSVVDPARVLLNRQDAEQYARNATYRLMRDAGVGWLSNTIEHFQLEQEWGEYGGEILAYFNPEAENGPVAEYLPWTPTQGCSPLLKVLYRWGTDLDHFDGKVPEDATDEELDLFIAHYDIREFVVLELEIEINQQQLQAIRILEELDLKIQNIPRYEPDKNEQAVLCYVASWLNKMTDYNSADENI